MQKQEHIFKKENNQLRPCYPEAYWDMHNKIKDGNHIKCTFQDVKKSKTQPQLAYLFAVAYPEALAWFKELSGDTLYHREFNDLKVPVKATIESIDTLFKCLYALHKGYEIPKTKTKMNVTEMSEYIQFICDYCLENFGKNLTEARKDSRIMQIKDNLTFSS